MPKAVVRGGMVQMLDEAGSPVQVPRESLGAAYQQGWTLEAPEALATREAQAAEGKRRAAADTLGQEALAFVEGAGSGLTFGLSDQLLVEALGEDYRASSKLRREVNPLATGAGEIAGALAPALASGGGSLGIRAALAPGRAIAGLGAVGERAAVRALGEGTLGKIAGGAISGAVENTAFSLGRANADAALGGTQITAEKLLSTIEEGIIWGAAGGGIVAGGTQAIGKAGDYVASKMLGEGATMRSALQDWAANRAIKGVTAEALPVSAERATALGKRILDEGIPVHDAAAAAKAVQAAAQKADEVVSRVAKLADDAQVKPDVQQVFTAADDAARKLRDTPTPEFQAAAKRIDAELEPLLNAATAPGGRGVNVQDLLSVRQGLTAASAGAGPAAEAARTVRQALDDTLASTFERVSDDALHAAAAAGDAPAAALLRDKRGAKEAFLQATRDADDWRMLADAAGKQPAPALRDKLADLGQSTILGLLTGIATGDVNAGMAVGVLGSRVGSVAKEYALQRGMGTLMKMADRVAKVDAHIDSAAAAIATGTDRAGSSVTQGNTGGLLPGFYARLRDQVAAAEKGEVTPWLTQEVAAEHPEIAEAMQERVLGDAAYLKKRFPTAFTPADISLRPFSEEDAPVSEVELRALGEAAKALNQPAAVARDLAAGRYSPEAWTALKTRRPELYGELKTKVMQNVMSEGKQIPYERRVMLGLAFDFPTDWSMLPKNLAAIQAVAPTPPAPSQQGSQRANIDTALADSYALPSNPVEAMP